MKLNIKYFGKIVEHTIVAEENIEIENEIKLNELESLIQNKYPELKNESFKIAVNQQFVKSDFILNTDCEIALLPPFAGG